MDKVGRWMVNIFLLMILILPIGAQSIVQAEIPISIHKSLDFLQQPNITAQSCAKFG
jgi:hypothetical protein